MKKGIKRYILLLISLVLLYFVFVDVNWSIFINSFHKVNPLYIIILIICILTAIGLRGLCFKLLIYKTVKIPLKEAVLLCISASAFNIVLPARAGDIFRAYYVGKEYNTDKIKIFGTVILERILDLFVISSLLLTATFLYNKNGLTLKMCCAGFILLTAGFIFAFLTYKYNLSDRIFKKITGFTDKLPFSDLSRKIINYLNEIFTSFCSGFEVLDSPARLGASLLTVFSIWFFECMNYFITMKAFGLDFHFSLPIFITCFIVFAGLIPSASIFLGPTQIAVIAAFALYHESKETALAVSFFEQGLCTISVIIVAIYFLLTRHVSLSKIKENINE